MKVSYFETLPYLGPNRLPPEWPMPPGSYDPEVGVKAFEDAMRTLTLVEEIGFDWVSLSEHHYTGRLQAPTPIVAAGYMASHLKRMTIAMLGPHMPLNNPVRVAEELAMLDNLSHGRLVVGLLRGTPNEYQAYGVNPAETRERTTEGMELVLKAWTEPHPFSWEGHYFRFRTVSVWPRPFQQPHPPTYVLGGSRESSDFAARHRLGLGVAFSPFEMVARSTEYYRQQCDANGWRPAPEQIIYRANILVAESDEEAQEQLALYYRNNVAPFPMRATILKSVLEMVPGAPVPGSQRDRVFESALPVPFVGGPATIIEQVKRCREVVGAGVIDISFVGPTPSLEAQRRALEIFGDKILPQVQGI